MGAQVEARVACSRFNAKCSANRRLVVNASKKGLSPGRQPFSIGGVTDLFSNYKFA